MAQSLNRYAYAVNNPLRYTDRTGNMPDGLSASAASQIGGSELSSGAYQASSHLDDALGREESWQVAGRSWEDNASSLTFVEWMQDTTRKRAVAIQTQAAQVAVGTAFALLTLPLRNPLSQGLAFAAESYVEQAIAYELGVEGAPPPSLQQVLKDTVTNTVLFWSIGKGIGLAGKGLGKLTQKVRKLSPSGKVGAAADDAYREERALVGSGKGGGQNGRWRKWRWQADTVYCGCRWQSRRP